jgi:hypothetical protein
MNADKPTPRIDSASPVATWFPISVSTTTANSQDINTPAAMPANTPSQRLPVSKVTAKPAIAPIDIMPSAPRFRTPDFSAINWPSATMISGVPATMVANRIEVRIEPSITNPPSSAGDN